MNNWLKAFFRLPAEWIDFFIDPFYSARLVLGAISVVFVFVAADALVVSNPIFEHTVVSTMQEALLLLGKRTIAGALLLAAVWFAISMVITTVMFALVSLVYAFGKFRGDKSVDIFFD